MAKILKIKIARVVNGGRTIRTYPPEYDREKIAVITYEVINCLADIELRNDGYEYCIGVVSDEDAAAFLLSDDITELTPEEAELQGAIWRPQVTKIVNEAVISEILDKVLANTPLSQEEKNAIDPDNAETGRARGRAFATLLNNTMIKIG